MKIITDSAADMTAQELEALGVALAPLFINFPEGEVSSAQLTPDEFYARLIAMYPAIPTTAQPSQGIFSQLYQEAVAAGNEHMLSIHISSGLSGSVNAARLGAEHAGLEKAVSIWDTLTLSGGQRFQVVAAAKMAALGWDLPRIEARLAQIRAACEVVFTLETIEYLARGGRIGRVQGFAGMLLNIKPVIHVDHADGKYNTLAKSRSDAKAVTAIVDFLSHTYGREPLCVAVLHGQAAERADTLAKLLGERLNVAQMERARVSPVLGVHTGAGIVGASAVPLRLLSDLM